MEIALLLMNDCTHCHDKLSENPVLRKIASLQAETTGDIETVALSFNKFVLCREGFSATLIHIIVKACLARSCHSFSALVISSVRNGRDRLCYCHPIDTPPSGRAPGSGKDI